MRKFIAAGGVLTGVWLLFFLCNSKIAFAETSFFETVPPVQSVDFYPNGAKFTFRVEAEQGKGFDFTLPGAFDQESLRCLTQGAVTSLKTESFQVKETPAPELEPFRQKRDDARRVVLLLEAQEAALNQTLTMLQHNPFPSASGGKSEGNGAMYWGPAWTDHIANSQKMRLSADTELVEVREALSKAKEVLSEATVDFDTLQQELKERKPYKSTLALRISGTSELTTVLLFEAFTSAAGWKAEHEMDMDGDTGDINTKTSAVTHQNTGLDVEGDFAFHTRRPTVSVNPPDIAPLPVSLRSLRQQETNSRSNVDEKMGAPVPMYYPHPSIRYYPTTPAPVVMADMAAAQPEVISTLASVTVKGKGRIESGNAVNRVTLGEFELKSTPVLIVVPEQNREAWLVASIDSVPDTLLPGLAKLAVDGASVGQTSIPESVAGRMNLSFGMSAHLTSKKEPFVGKTESSWLGTKGMLNDGYTIEITSALATEREVTVRDRIPIPTTDKISLESLKIEPAPTERDKENRLLWKIKIKPGETKKITVEYTLRYPADDALEY